VDLPVVQRPRDRVVAVPATRQGVVRGLERQHWHDEGQPSGERRHGPLPTLTTDAVNHRQRQEAARRLRRLVTIIILVHFA